MHVGDRRVTSRSQAAANSIASLGGGLAGAVPRAFGIALGVFFAPLRILAGLNMMGALGGNRKRAEAEMEIQSFRTRLSAGDVVECVLRGENRSGEVALGDRVRVHGRRSFRAGNLINVTRVVNLDTGTVIRPHVPFGVRYALPLAVAKLAVGCCILLVLLTMCGVIR
ncbi:hypothetical protein [Mycobacterium sp. NPDC050041]|uniref:hypothetical protein n=1 Tax=Mycobacterium sp. NPDC050041 TaxID=3364293 RepID=UPI003C2F06D4